MRYLLAPLLLICATAVAHAATDTQANDTICRAEQAAQAQEISQNKPMNQANSKQASADSEISMGWMNLKQGNNDGAIRHFEQAAQLAPENAEVHWGLGVAMTRVGKYSVAAQHFGKALALLPDNPHLLADVGLAHTQATINTVKDPAERQMRLGRVLPWYDAAEKIDPTVPTIYANRAVTLYQMGKLTAAQDNVSKAEAISPGSVDPALVTALSSKMATSSPSAQAPTEPTPTAQVSTAPAPTAQAPAEPVTDTQTPATQVPTETAPTAQAPIVPTPTTQEIPAAHVKPEAVTAQSAPQQQALPEHETKASEDKQAPKRKSKKTREAKDDGQNSAKRGTGQDKRYCLDLPTNEAIMRCVYPRK